MEIVILFLLTTLAFCSIIVILKKIEKYFFRKTKYRQSDIRNITKSVSVSKMTKPEKKSQVSERLNKNSINVVILEDKAYWVSNNVFYSADFVNGNINQDTAQPIDTDKLSLDEIQKMMFVLDKLGMGDNNDSGSTR